jgi:hypothetical protein
MAPVAKGPQLMFRISSENAKARDAPRIDYNEIGVVLLYIL